jgi:hypothetical protein
MCVKILFEIRSDELFVGEETLTASQSEDEDDNVDITGWV